MKTFAASLCLCIFALPVWALPMMVGAQQQGLQSMGSLGLSNNQVTLKQRPQIVQPQQNVDFELVSYNTDINRAQVGVYLNDTLVSQRVGLKNFTVPAPKVGERTRIRVVVRTVDRGTIEKYATLRPARVDLLYEATNSYAPPLYEGKKLPAGRGGVRVVAMPYFVNDEGVKIDPGSLVYTWKVDDQVQPQKSGYGQYIFDFEGSPYYRTRDVSVRVETVEAAQIAERTIQLPAYDPVVRFYEEHPVWGMDLSQAITADEDLVLQTPEMAVRAVPFFVSDINSPELVSYDWRMNGEQLTTYGDRNLLNLRAPEDGSGESQVRLEVSHNNNILQIAKSLFTVRFGVDAAEESGSSQNFFGVGS